MNEIAAAGGYAVSAPTIIGATPARFPIGGKIRSGIKVRTPTAEKHVEARQIYESGLDAGRSFDDIEDIARSLPRFVILPDPYFTSRVTGP